MAESDAYQAGLWILAEVAKEGIDPGHIHELLVEEFGMEPDEREELDT
jgi:hypothetical protein